MIVYNYESLFQNSRSCCARTAHWGDSTKQYRNTLPYGFKIHFFNTKFAFYDAKLEIFQEKCLEFYKKYLPLHKILRGTAPGLVPHGN